MYLAIDRRELIREPHTIEISLPNEEVTETADGRPHVRPGGEYAVINCTWGNNVSHQDVLRELDRRRANRGVHAVSFELWGGDCHERVTLNCWMGRPKHTHIRQLKSGKYANASFTVPFYQVDTPTFLVPLRFRLPGIIAVGDAMCVRVAPAAGEIFGIDGFIRDLGSGAGQTRIQVRNATTDTDYLSTPGDFPQGGNHVLANKVLTTDTTFAQGDEISIDVDDIPAGGLSKDASITLWTWLFRP